MIESFNMKEDLKVCECSKPALQEPTDSLDKLCYCDDALTMHHRICTQSVKALI